MRPASVTEMTCRRACSAVPFESVGSGQREDHRLKGQGRCAVGDAGNGRARGRARVRVMGLDSRRGRFSFLVMYTADDMKPRKQKRERVINQALALVRVSRLFFSRLSLWRNRSQASGHEHGTRNIGRPPATFQVDRQKLHRDAPRGPRAAYTRHTHTHTHRNAQQHRLLTLNWSVEPTGDVLAHSIGIRLIACTPVSAPEREHASAHARRVLTPLPPGRASGPRPASPPGWAWRVARRAACP